MKIAVIGYRKNTANYENYLSLLPASPVTTLSVGILSSCDAVVLPGGGDVNPSFFQESDSGSRNIDTELDVLQFQALEYAIRHRIPVMGICKGMQLINIAFGGTLTQHLPTADIHQYIGKDQYHEIAVTEGSFLEPLYGRKLRVNSAHHQGLHVLGKDLTVAARCPQDQCVEAIRHASLPVFGLQWHPERLDPEQTGVTGKPLLAFLASLVSAAFLAPPVGVSHR
ncbi:MAG: gamma-glutamyl-gamma-aminobutyrate hydrolase family protein [Clostridium sp.]|nr:gamma-glutamyl-gamma-aminobutyrate hydrolase family protein [Clostridium sp.]